MPPLLLVLLFSLSFLHSHPFSRSPEKAVVYAPIIRFELQILLESWTNCPLDFSWSNFSLVASTCSDQNERGKCCRYINAYVAISIARYANSTGKLGVPPAFSELCLNSISETFQFYGVSPNATAFCGLGAKIRVSYQCNGRGTVLEMMQSPYFSDVISSCNMSLSSDISCKACLNSGILYLRRLIGDDNLSLSICRDAVFVTLANQGENLSIDDMATCFFGVQGLNTLTESPSKPISPASSPNLISDDSPTKNITGVLAKRHYHAYRLTMIPGIGIGIILVTVVLLLILVVLIRKKSRELKRVDSPNETSWNEIFQTQVRRCQEGSSAMFRRYSYKETKKATDNFSTEIGKGGFGTVYKAQFSDGSIAAVKRMNKVSKQGEEEFCREMELLARLHHRHLVSLKGFCVESNERFLVYEYMENGSLKDYLHSPGRSPLRWETRLQIAIDVANALEYLHFYCDPPLCHRDIKSSNILLDENFVAKVADFGLHTHRGLVQLALNRNHPVVHAKRRTIAAIHQAGSGMLSEAVDQAHNGLEDEIAENCYVGGRSSRERFSSRNELMILHSGDVRCLQSSSSTSRSYCSRSVLLESGSPQSPHGLFSL
uniref:Protein kinase domain-containing protein n=1 Tax=Ananas comosus var. bracteatus TaxID=296719 RepID=A0A6V7Q6C0_ANACO|nr:unnamed protein product [Ananas comosus var. bracteatus]